MSDIHVTGGTNKTRHFIKYCKRAHVTETKDLNFETLIKSVRRTYESDNKHHEAIHLSVKSETYSTRFAINLFFRFNIL